MDPDSRSQIFARKLDGSVRRVQVSAQGGSQPRWTKGGREIVYRRGADVFAVNVDPPTGRMGTPALLFSVPDDATLVREAIGYDVTRDGQRFLMAVPEERRGSLPYIVITNWLSELRERVPR